MRPARAALNSRELPSGRAGEKLAKRVLHLTVNGRATGVAAEPNQTLAQVLRDELNLTGTKIGCDMGTCGCCTVLIDGRARLSCLTLALECEGASVTTIEGLNIYEMHALQRAFAECGGSQCGFCTAGFIMKSVALIEKTPDPSIEHLRQQLAGNLCRCTGYTKIYDAVQRAAAELRSPELQQHGPPRRQETALTPRTATDPSK